MSGPFRTTGGGVLIDRSRPIDFAFDDRAMTGYAGDTLASALLANGVRVVSRSFKHRRRRGIVAAGPEEPNALVTVGSGAEAVPNLKATEIPLHHGLVAHGQRGWPTVHRDLGAARTWLYPLLPPGFYYKTFMRPRSLWPQYEEVLRRAAGGGRPSSEPDPGRYDKLHVYGDVLVVGGGPAGLAVADGAARSGARVILAEQTPAIGGALHDHDLTVDGLPGLEWRSRVAETVDSTGMVLRSTTVFGWYGRGRFGAVQLLDGDLNRQRLWHIQADHTVLATGAIERPLVFEGNDLPGVMLASAAGTYLGRFGVAPGHRIAVATNNDSAYRVVDQLRMAGVEVVAVIDTRAELPTDFDRTGIPAVPGITSMAARGRSAVERVTIISPTTGELTIACDAICVSGGWTPTTHLWSGGGGSTHFDPAWGAGVPDAENGPGRVISAGACNGTQGLASIVAEGWNAGLRAAQHADQSEPADPPPATGALGRIDVGPSLPSSGLRHAFVDLSTDVDTHDIEVSIREGFEGTQHVKRYTTLGMGPDQGKTSNVNAAQMVAELTGRPRSEVGTTTYRPPYTPITLGALAGRETATRIAPVRRSPIHQWHSTHGAVFMPSGLWTRPQYYAEHGSNVIEAATREARNVRRNVGITDVSTLGKIELWGRDVPDFLDRVYVNNWQRLPVGKARYGVMLRDDGYVFDDGTTARLEADHYLMTTTTGNAEAVLQHLEFYHQQVWPNLDVTITAVTEQWAVVAVAGPRSRDVLARVVTDEVGDQALPFMGVLPTRIAGMPARVSRISFSGELGYEVAIPSDYGVDLWEALLAAGEPDGIIPYGLEAMDYLRIEKGHLVVGMDIDGRVIPSDLGLQRMCSTKKDFIGRRSLALPAFSDPDRPQLAGFISADGTTMITAGAQLVGAPFDGSPQSSLGRITSRAYSPALDAPIALGLIAGGPGRYDAPVYAASPVTGEQARVEVVPPHFYDPAGERMRG